MVPFTPDWSLFLLRGLAIGLAAIAVAAVLIAVAPLVAGCVRGNAIALRCVSWAIIAPLFTAAALWGSASWTLLLALVAALGLREYARLVKLPRAWAIPLVLAGAAALPLVALDRALGVPALVAVMLAGSLGAILTQDVDTGLRRLSLALFGLLYLPGLLAFGVALRHDFEAGPQLLLALGAAVALSDVGAFLAGKAFGRRRLAPRLSPNKTWAGFAGNIAGAYVAVGCLAFLLPSAERIILLVAFPLAAGLSAVWGDLLESLIKRSFGAKDTGRLLPGMGGVLDRVDSLLVALPVAYASLALLGTRA